MDKDVAFPAGCGSFRSVRVSDSGSYVSDGRDGLVSHRIGSIFDELVWSARRDRIAADSGISEKGPGSGNARRSYGTGDNDYFPGVHIRGFALYLLSLLSDICTDDKGRELERIPWQHRLTCSDGIGLWRLDTCSRDHAGGGIKK